MQITSLLRLEKLKVSKFQTTTTTRAAVRGTTVSRHHGGPSEGTPVTPLTITERCRIEGTPETLPTITELSYSGEGAFSWALKCRSPSRTHTDVTFLPV